MSRSKAAQQGKVRRAVKSAEAKVDKKIDGKKPERSKAVILLERDYGAKHQTGKLAGQLVSRKLQAVHAMHDLLEGGDVLSVEEMKDKLAKYGITAGEIKAQAKIETGGTGRANPRWKYDRKGKLTIVEGYAKPNWRSKL